MIPHPSASEGTGEGASAKALGIAPDRTSLHAREGLPHRSSGTYVTRRLVVVTEDPAQAQPAAEALLLAGYPLTEIVEDPEELDQRGTVRSISVVAAKGRSAALRACGSIRGRILAATILLLATADGPTAIEAGADQFWAPEWGVERLGEAVRRWVRPGAVYIADGRVWLYDEPLKLNGTPLKLACYLVNRAHGYCDQVRLGPVPPACHPVVTREQIKSEIWDQRVVSDHAVDQKVYIVRVALGTERRRLRKVATEGYWLSVL